MPSKTVLVICSISVGLVAFVLGIVGLCTNHWRTGGQDSIGLWKKCDGVSCDDLQVGQSREYYAFETVRGFGILAVAMAFGGLTFGILSLLVKKLNVNPSVLATFFLMGGLFGLICASVFSSLSHSAATSWGYSFILTWIAFPFSLVAGGMMTYVALSSDDD